MKIKIKYEEQYKSKLKGYIKYNKKKKKHLNIHTHTYTLRTLFNTHILTNTKRSFEAKYSFLAHVYSLILKIKKNKNKNAKEKMLRTRYALKINRFIYVHCGK